MVAILDWYRHKRRVISELCDEFVPTRVRFRRLANVLIELLRDQQLKQVFRVCEFLLIDHLVGQASQEQDLALCRDTVRFAYQLAFAEGPEEAPVYFAHVLR